MSEKQRTCENLPKKVYIRTFGCQMNERDSEMVGGLLMDAGYVMASKMNEADIVLYNTCSVREHAETRALGNIRQLAGSKEGAGPFIGVIGCMARRYGEKLFDLCPEVALVMGPNNIFELPGLLQKVISGEKVIAADSTVRPKQKEILSHRRGGLSAYVNITYGCDNFCSYCIVPYVRGRETSRPKNMIVKEVKDLASRGFKQITLLGQNVNSYGKGQRSKISFPELLEALNGIKDIERIRFTTSHPKDASSDLFRAMRDLEKVAEHIHLPLQAGSDRVLDLMNRGYTLNDYMRKLDLARKTVPGLSVTTDIIVGFPSEREEDYMLTKKAMQQIRFNSAFIFKYSPRPPAVSSKLADDVPEKEKKKRNAELLDLQRGISREVNSAMVGNTEEILAESRSRLSKAELMGRTRNNTPCVFPADKSFIGKILRVRITDTTENTLIGERLDE